MNSKVYMLFSMVISLNSFCQKGFKSFRQNGCSNFYGYELGYSKLKLIVPELNSYLDLNYGNKISEIPSVGLNLKYFLSLNREGLFDVNMSFNYIVPQTLTSNINSNSFNIKGYQLGYMFFGKDFLYKSKMFDFIFGVGFNGGRFIITENINDIDFESKNGFFSPKLSNDFRVIIGRCSIGLRTEYQWDTSSRYWTSNSIPETRFSGLNIQAFVGIGWLRKE